MGRIFETRKHKMFKRYDRMAKAFTRIGKEISIAVKQAGPNPEYNPRLRTAIQNAKGVNMPKDRIEAAIKRASSKEEGNYEEVVYEGYGPYGVAIIVETATDNTNRTVANIRSIFSKANGSLGKTGSLDFIFTRKSVFKFKKDNLDIESLELELIDHGLEELAISDEGDVYVYTSFVNFGNMQKILEEKNITLISSELQRIPNSTVQLNEEQEKEVLELIDKLEEDDDVQAVYHNMA
ncbi:MAG: YebC/PmpR family DNA-binding transcriptional regulator [Cytophagaceae bacterium]|nr:YebC/PmpR family DNA-binding transcriptional regulator [Cytophagaceae bacterium]MDW8456919.1 YebC/PmpR family DNA-binding transcriptional regulator [Cytophagaceae bacterium]